MTITLRSASLQRLAPGLLADGQLTAAEARTILVAAKKADSARMRADVAEIVAVHGAQLPAAERDALISFIARSAPSTGTSDTRRGGDALAARSTSVVGPEQAARVGDLVQAPKITWTPQQILRGLATLEHKLALDPDLKARLRAQPWPSSSSANASERQLEWALAYELGDDRLSDPLWITATNDSAAAATRLAHGIVGAARANIDLAKIEERIAAAEMRFHEKGSSDPGLYERIATEPFPSSPAQQLEWAVGMQYAWDPAGRPGPAGVLVDLVGAVFAKRANNTQKTVVVSERKTVDVDGDTRVYAVHTPPGPKPANGWPTVVFFHGSWGGHAPEQNASYQQLNDVADRQGHQVLYLVGTPQDRNDSSTGRGMLNWDPVGAGPGGSNDRFVHTLLADLVNAGDVDKTRVIAAGHSQGGYYVTGLLAAYPDVFAGAAIFGAGAGSVMGEVGARGTRATPTYVFVGKDDVHLESGDALAHVLRESGKPFTYDSPRGRGHEVLASDFERMFAVLGAETHLDSPLGTTDGRTMTGAEGRGDAGHRGPVFRTHLDVNAPPPELARDRAALWLTAQLAHNPWLNLDGDNTKLTVNEWKQALRFLHTWPPAMQKQIAALRQHFVTAPPPANALDLSKTASPIWADRDMARAAWLLNSEPAFDLDGYPGLITLAEVDAGLRSAAVLKPDQVRGLQKLRAMLVDEPTTGNRSVSSVPGLGRLETFAGSRDAELAVRDLVASLSTNPDFARVLARTTVIVSPPGAGLDRVAELGAGYASTEGVAMFAGPDGETGPPTLAIRHDSITTWDLGAAHEIVHLLVQDRMSGPGGDAFTNELVDIRERIRLPGSVVDDYANEHELAAFFGQWHLAGYGAIIRQLDPGLADFLQRTLGDTRIKDPGFGQDGARTTINSLFQWFQTGTR